MTEHTFQRTGHFWIDNGICGLWRALLEMSNQEEPTKGSGVIFVNTFGAEAILSADSLVLRGRSDAVQAAEEGALKALKKSLCRRTKAGKEWWYGPAFFLLSQMSDPTSFFLTVDGERGKTRAQGICDFCGRQGNVKPVGTTEFPLLVTLEKMTSFYSGLVEAQTICQMCVFASKFALLSALYQYHEQKQKRKQKDLLKLFMLDDIDLLSLDSSIRAYSRLAAEANHLHKIPLSVTNVQYANESFVAFLIETLKAYKQRFPKQNEKDLKASGRWHLLAFNRSGKTTSVEFYAFVPDVSELIRTIEILDWEDTAGKRHNALNGVVVWMWFPSGGQVDSVLREELCLRIMQRIDIAEVVAEAVFEAVLVRPDKTIDDYDAINLRNLVYEYERQVIGIDERVLVNAKNVGTALGKLAAKTERKSILYELRSTRNLQDLLDAINHVLTRDLGDPPVGRYALEELLREVNDGNWKVFRSLIGIYAALGYANCIRRQAGEATT